MIYSVWQQAKGVFDYYQTPNGAAKLNTEKPSHLRNRTLGSTVDQAAWPLPANATLTGSGQQAVGRVATNKSSSALGDASSDSNTKILLLALSGFLLWKYVVKPGRRRRR